MIGHAITRGDGMVANTTGRSRPRMLNQARFGYTRRDLNQTSLQNGGITVPGAAGELVPFGAAASSRSPDFSRSVRRPAPTSNFTTSVTEYLDTFSMVRAAGTRSSSERTSGARRSTSLNPPNPTGAYAFTTTGTNSDRRAVAMRWLRCCWAR